MSDLLSIINSAARPFKSFTVQIGEKTLELKTRALSATESDELGEIFNQEFERVTSEMEQGNVDITILRRNLSRQSKEALAKLITRANRVEYYSEASTELDDKPFSDPAVKQLADEKQEEAYKLLLGADEEEVLDKAIEHRAFVAATLKATDKQNQHFLYLTVYNQDETPGFEKPEDIAQLDRDTIALFINAVNRTLRGGPTPNPLSHQAKKPAGKRSQSRKVSVEA